MTAINRLRFSTAALIVVFVQSGPVNDAKSASTARLEIVVQDDAGAPLPCRIHLADQQGNAQKADGQPFWHDHFVCAGRATVALPPGEYAYAIERGPEYLRQTGQRTMVPDENRTLHLRLERFANLRAANWYCGDLHVHRPVADIEALMRAEDLDFAPVITWWNNRNTWVGTAVPKQVEHRFDGHRLYSLMAGEDEREGGALLYFGLHEPLQVSTDDREHPSPLQFVEAARQREPAVWIDIEKPFWWDVPVWLASERMNSIGLANNHMCRSQMYPSEAWGRPRDTSRLPAPLGNGYWTQEIYYHMLNAGLRLPPSAGSASGVLPNPVGYNRVYVHLDEPFTREAWFRGLSRGNCFVTNGPLLLASADGQLPGSAIELQPGQRRSVRVTLQLTSQDRIRELALIHNGAVAATVECSDEQSQSHAFDLAVDGPGWFLVRAIADLDSTFRFASTAPWFIEVSGTPPRISRASVEFFREWANERTERARANVADDAKRQQVLEWHEKAAEFWATRLRMATAP